MLPLVLSLLATTAAPDAVPEPAAASWDVVVYGSSPAGIAAATAAGVLGLRVAVYEPLGMIGGMGAAGFLALHDMKSMQSITGLARNFTMLNAAHYNTTVPVVQPESFVSEASFYTMLKNAGVTKANAGVSRYPAARAAATGANASGPCAPSKSKHTAYTQPNKRAVRSA